MSAPDAALIADMIALFRLLLQRADGLQQIGRQPEAEDSYQRVTAMVARAEGDKAQDG
jgi:hypothetical protein